MACQVVSERVDKPRNIEFKGATDLVTDTDKASEDAVLSVTTLLKPFASSLVNGAQCDSGLDLHDDVEQ